jgi:adenylate cyclase
MLDAATPELEIATADAGGHEAEGLDPALVAPALAIRDWLLSETAHFEDFGEILPGVAERLTALGVPIDRITTAIDALHSELGSRALLDAGGRLQAATVPPRSRGGRDLRG